MLIARNDCERRWMGLHRDPNSREAISQVSKDIGWAADPYLRWSIDRRRGDCSGWVSGAGATRPGHLGDLYPDLVVRGMVGSQTVRRPEVQAGASLRRQHASAEVDRGACQRNGLVRVTEITAHHCAQSCTVDVWPK